ncbi:hypothetical protein RchiOBHm_Chr6g0259771 [Rosa chinensis]|uniref:Uncharacterized protein n=1 Tax=Rosa chinensis TaxID=74649 RepID=A0A2P6PMY7_ROSCH|nr:hypothetical protein RchiOBHm_Chr6g0259771 [Rosa chinensis]
MVFSVFYSEHPAFSLWAPSMRKHLRSPPAIWVTHRPPPQRHQGIFPRRFQRQIPGVSAPALPAKLENQVRYDFNVSGTLTFGRIADLSGVSAQELFLWFPVKGIRVDVPSSGLIYFDVGVVDKQFSLSLFESPPYCTALDPSDPSSPSSSSNSPSELKLKVDSDSDSNSNSNSQFDFVASI